MRPDASGLLAPIAQRPTRVLSCKNPYWRLSVAACPANSPIAKKGRHAGQAPTRTPPGGTDCVHSSFEFVSRQNGQESRRATLLCAESLVVVDGTLLATLCVGRALPVSEFEKSLKISRNDSKENYVNSRKKRNTSS